MHERMVTRSYALYLVMLGSVLGVPARNNTVQISTYAKVAKWGAVNHDMLPEEGRSSGQSLFTQRSDAKVRTGQNIPKDVTYHYVNSRVDSGKKDKVPGQGEAVIQDRFNPPPYFDYANDAKQQSQNPNPSIVYGAPADSFQPSNFQPSMDTKPSFDSAGPSYDTMPSDDSKDVDAKPSDPYDSPISSYNPIPSGTPSKPSYPSYAPQSDDKPDKPKFPGYVYDPPMMDSDGGKFAGPYAPMEDSNPMNPEYDNQGPPVSQTAEPPNDESFLDHPPHYKHHGHKPDDDADLSPPPAAGFPKNIPEYLDHDPLGHHHHHSPYSFDDHHHHVYHEVKTTTTTTEAPEDERVNKGHYSYYYLGRKLWYIPLYFSVYFIIYITVLILKSIARHKVNFAHDWNDKGKGRSIGSDVAVDESAADVNDKIDGFRRRYIAM